MCCVVGADDEGALFRADAARMRIDTAAIVTDPLRKTTTKLRIVAAHQHMLRIDRETQGPITDATREALIRAMKIEIEKAEAILLSDYDKGVLTPEVCTAAIAAAGNKPILADPKGSLWNKYSGVTLLKPNFNEACACLSLRAEPARMADDAETQRMAEGVRAKSGATHVMLTRSAHGFSLAQTNSETFSVPGRNVQVRDEAGAGDAVAATACLALAAGAPVAVSAWLGNLAGSVKVSKFGTHAVNDFEILEALGGSFSSSQRKLFTPEQAADFSARMRAEHKKVVFTNGCFDILHLGHVTYLEKARALGDSLIVALNTDDSVRRLKGPDRPVNPQDDRSRVISALSCVDAVVLFSQDTPYEMIRAIKPDVLCKGADYKTKQDVVGWDLVEANGGRVALIDLVAGRSTSSVIQKMRG